MPRSRAVRFKERLSFGAVILWCVATLALVAAIAGSASAETGRFGAGSEDATPSEKCLLRDLHYGLTSCIPGGRGSRLAIKDVAAKVKEAGYKDIFSIEFEHGRYEIEARNRTGRKVLIIADPRTGKPRVKSYGWVRLTGSYLAAEEIMAEVREAGYGDTYSFGREHAMYEIVTRAPQGALVKLHIHPKTGRLIRHPRTSRPFSIRVSESDAAGPYVAVSDILIHLHRAGYTEVYSLEPKNDMYQCIARDPNGQLALFLINPKTGEIREHP